MSANQLRTRLDFIKEFDFRHYQGRYGMRVVEELRRFFTLAALNQGTSIGMFSKKVDEIWHTLVLDTESYTSFCEQAFGQFLHHVPAKTMRRTGEKMPKKSDFISLYEKAFGHTPPKMAWGTSTDCVIRCRCKSQILTMRATSTSEVNRYSSGTTRETAAG